MLDAQGAVRKDIFKPRGDIHLNALGTQIVSLRIQQMLAVMLPNLVLVQAPVSAPVTTPAPVGAKVQRTRVQAPVPDSAPVVVNEQPPVVNAPLVADVVNAPAVVVQGQVETPMEVEDEDALLQRLFFKKYGRALPDETEKESEVDQIKFVIDLTDDSEEMEDDATPLLIPIPIVKTEPIEAPENVANVTNADKVAADRKERRELVKGRKALIAFGKTLRKSVKIPEKEVSADSNVSADTSVKPVRTAEQAEMDAEQEEFVAEFGDIPLDEFDDESEFRLYGPEDVLPSDDDDAMIKDI